MITELDQALITRLRDMACKGESVAVMFKGLKTSLHTDSIVTILDYFRSAFCLSLAEAKPIAALSRTAQREIVDEAMLDELVTPEINKHRSEWDTG